MNEQDHTALETVRKDLGNWRTFRRMIRLPGRVPVGLIYAVTVILGALLLGKLLLLNHTMEIAVLQVLLLVGVALVDQPVMLGMWLYVVLAFICLLIVSVILYWWRRRQIDRLYRDWVDGTNTVDVVYLEPLVDDLVLVYTAKTVPTAVLPVALAREADEINTSRLAFRLNWQRTLQSISARQFISRDDILARVISVTRPFGAVAPVDVTTSNVQHYVGLMNVAGGQVTLAVGIQWHNRTVFFKAHRHVKMARLVVKAAEGRTNV